MDKSTWLGRIEAKRRAQAIRAVVGMAVLMAIYVSLIAIACGVWFALYHHMPGALAAHWFEGIGSFIILPLGGWIPFMPMKGKDPEVIAADEFFKGPQR